LFDIGVNLTNSRFDKDRDAVLNRAQFAGIRELLITGTCIESSQQALSLCHQYEQVFPNMLFSTAGVHPHDADRVEDNYLEKIRQLVSQPTVLAIGECGLDFNRNFSAPVQQQKVFAEQVTLAAELALPLFLHQRDAFQPWFDTLAPYFSQVPAMVTHCFTGSKTELQQCLAADMYIGITGWICDERRGQALRDIVSMIPLERLLIETDAPYLTPRTIRPKPKSSRNEPSYLSYVLNEISLVTRVDAAEIANQTRLNARQVFGLDRVSMNNE